jgi:hypothetical protein
MRPSEPQQQNTTLTLCWADTKKHITQKIKEEYNKGGLMTIYTG